MSSSQQQLTSSNPSYLKNKFAHRFIRALDNLNHTKTSSHNHNHMYRRTYRVKIAANTAMASVVGSRRAWSRSVLWRIKKRSRNRGSLLLRMDRKKVDNKITNCLNRRHVKVMSLKRRNPNHKRQDYNIFGNGSQESKLRKLVPGSETMDSWSLMVETADYIKCLAAQVEVMKTLVDIYATT